MAIRFNDVEKLFRVRPDSRVRLKDYDPEWAGGREFKDLETDELKERAKKFLDTNRAELREAQERLWATDIHSVLIVLQAMDAAGKDGTIKHVMSGVNPQGCQVFSFKKPSDEELDHNFLWRYMRALPERGRIGIFNRSYYEEVLVVRVHPEILDRQKLPPGKRGQAFWETRFDDIRRFERHLARNGTHRPEVLSAHLAGRTEAPLPGAPRAPGEELEVLDGGPRGTRALGRLPAGLRGRAGTHEHEVGAMVGDSRESQVDCPDARVRHHDARDPGPEARRRRSSPRPSARRSRVRESGS